MRLIQTLLVSISVLLALPAFATEVGESLPAYELTEDRGEKRTLDNTVKRIYATVDRKGDKLFAALFEERDQSVLDVQNAIVIADISGAPGFVKRIIRGSLEDRSYRTWMDTRGETKKTLPGRKNHVAVIELDNLAVTSIRFLNEEADLIAALSESDTSEEKPEMPEDNPEAEPAPSEDEPEAE